MLLSHRRKPYLAKAKPFAPYHFDYFYRYEISHLSVSSLSWPSFLKVNAGEPNSSERFRGWGARPRVTVAKVTFKTKPVS